MEIKVYNWEIVSRWKWWYIIYISVAIFVIVMSFLLWGLFSGFSVFFVFSVITAGYIILYLISQKIITIKIVREGLLIENKLYNWEQIDWYNIEYKDGKPCNIVFIVNWYPVVYTVQEKDISKFVEVLQEILLLDDNYNRSLVYKITRFLKL